jgi:hypothetical protein
MKSIFQVVVSFCILLWESRLDFCDDTSECFLAYAEVIGDRSPGYLARIPEAAKGISSAITSATRCK